ncbi:MAG: hypothetical protein GEU80_10225, partial [Dehalococcoidia bacterium]|nr:hypothetical protein [Dehalococcoidia bacterium]
MKLLVFHENAETVPSLFDAVGARAEVRTVRVCSPNWYLRVRLGGTGFAWGRPSEGSRRSVAFVPGLRRFPRASAFALRQAYRRAVRESGIPDAVVLDSPWLASLLDLAPGVPRVYFAADAYRYYSWPRDETVRRERLMLEGSDVAFAGSALLAGDLRAGGATEVHQSPTAVPAAFVQACRQPGPLPDHLAAIAGPRAGCVGIINETYDWTLLEGLAEASPDVAFVFVGPQRALTRS